MVFLSLGVLTFFFYSLDELLSQLKVFREYYQFSCLLGDNLEVYTYTMM
jgi:hypothetical protein